MGFIGIQTVYVGSFFMFDISSAKSQTFLIRIHTKLEYLHAFWSSVCLDCYEYVLLLFSVSFHSFPNSVSHCFSLKFGVR